MKTKIIMTLIVLISTVFTGLKSQSVASQYISHINKQMDAIPFVFEGQITSVEVFAGDDKGNRLPNSSAVWEGDIGYFYDSNKKEAKGYSFATIKVCKVFKGNLTGGSEIKVLTKSFTLDNVYLIRSASGDTTLRFLNVPPSHDQANKYDFILPHSSYNRKIYFCDKIKDIVSVSYSGASFVSNFHSAFEIPFDIPVDVPQKDGTIKRVKAYCAIIPYIMEDQTQVDNFLNQINGLESNPKSYCEAVKLETKFVEQMKIDNSKNAQLYDEWYKRKSERLKLLQQNNNGNKTLSTYDMNLDIVNERLEYTGGYNWFVFDVFISAPNTGFYMDGASMHIQYNSSVFGTYVVSGNDIVITTPTGFNTTNYYVLNTDISSNVTGIAVQDTSNAGRVLLNPTPQMLCTVKMKISSCNQPVNISFTDQSAMASLCAYATTINQSNLFTLPPDNVNYTGNITDNSCEPIITSWTNNVPCGIHQKVTINGKYFGNAFAVNAAVIMKNANKGDRYPAPGGNNSGGIQAYDLVSWSDTQIIIKLPEIFDSTYVYDAGNPAPVYAKVTPGTGKFKVRNFSGAETESNAPIIIPYSVVEIVDNQANTYAKAHVKLSDQTGGGYSVLVNNNVISTWSNATSIIRRAMKDWTCATGINWYIGGTTSTKYGVDNFCVIDTADISGLMETIPRVRTCISSGNPKYYLQSFDIKIRPSVSPSGYTLDTLNNISSGNYDWYSLISHELGHAHEVWHINDSINDLMWWQANPFGSLYAARKTVRGSPEARTGGEFVADSLLASGYNCTSVMTLTYFGNCDGFDVKVRAIAANIFNISVYPNPSYGGENVKVKFSLNKETDVSIVLFDITGKEVFRDQIAFTKDVNYDLRTKDILQGLYLLQVNVGANRQTFKVLKE